MKGLNFDYRQTDRILWIRYRIRDWQCSWKKLYKLLAEEKHIFCVKIVLWFFFLGHLHFHFFPKMRFCPSIWRIQPSSKCRDSTNKSSIESCQQRRFVSIFLLYNTFFNKKKNIYFLGASPIHEIGPKKVCQSPEIKVTIGDAV